MYIPMHIYIHEFSADVYLQFTITCVSVCVCVYVLLRFALCDEIPGGHMYTNTQGGFIRFSRKTLNFSKKYVFNLDSNLHVFVIQLIFNWQIFKLQKIHYNIYYRHLQKPIVSIGLLNGLESTNEQKNKYRWIWRICCRLFDKFYSYGFKYVSFLLFTFRVWLPSKQPAKITTLYTRLKCIALTYVFSNSADHSSRVPSATNGFSIGIPFARCTTAVSGTYTRYRIVVFTIIAIIIIRIYWLCRVRRDDWTRWSLSANKANKVRFPGVSEEYRHRIPYTIAEVHDFRFVWKLKKPHSRLAFLSCLKFFYAPISLQSILFFHTTFLGLTVMFFYQHTSLFIHSVDNSSIFVSHYVI